MPSLSSDNSVDIVIGTRADNSGIDQVSNSLGNMVDNFESGMKKISVATAVVGAGLTAFAKSSTTYLEGLTLSSKSLSRETGMNISQSSTLIAVLGRLGLSADTATSIFKIFDKQIQSSRDSIATHAIQVDELNNKISAAHIQVNQLTTDIQLHGDATGATAAKIQGLNLQIQSYQEQLTATKKPLDELNVSTQNADGSNRSFNDILMSVADKFQAMPDGVEKTAIALQLFGRNGQSMIKVLDQGSSGLQALETQASKLGLTLNAQNIGAISAYIQSQKNLKDSTDSIKISVGTLTAPILANFNNALSNVMQGLMGTDSPFRTVTANILAFGGPVLGATSALTGFLGNLDNASGILKGIGVVMMDPIFIIFTGALVAMGLAADGLAKKMGGWGNMFRDIQDRLKDVGDAIGNFIPSISSFGDSISQTAGDLASKFANGFIDVLHKSQISGTVIVGDLQKGDFKGAGEKIADVFIDGIKTIANRIGEITNAFGNVVGKVDWVGLGIKIGGKIVPGLVIGLAAGILNFDPATLISQLSKHLGDIFMAVLAIALLPEKIAVKIAELLAKIPFAGKIAEWGFNAVRDGGQAVIGKLFDWLKLFGQSFIDGLGLEGPKVIPAIKNFLLAIPNAIVDVAKNVDDKIGNMLIGMGSKIADLGPSQVVGAMQKVKSAILNAVSDAGSWLYDTGKSIISGLLKGIENTIGGIGGSIGNAASDVGGAVKNALHNIHIPGFAAGGYTGMGGINDVAGVVHKGEYVVPQSQVDQRTGLPKATMSKSAPIMNNTFNVYNNVDYSKGIAEIGFRLANA